MAKKTSSSGRRTAGIGTKFSVSKGKVTSPTPSAVFRFPDLMRRLILSWLLAVTLEVLLLPADLRDLTVLDGLAAMSLGRVILLTLGGTAALFALSRFVKTEFGERLAVPMVFALLAGVSLQASYTREFLLICFLLLALLVVYAMHGWRSEEAVCVEVQSGVGKGEGKSLRKKILALVYSGEKGSLPFLLLTALLGCLLFWFICSWTVNRYLTFSTPTYDFGIFAQMFYNMKETGIPVTTVERTGALSHFAVHVSPIYYLMLPFYMLFPSPVTLQVLQALVIASAVVPMWKIGRRHELSPSVRTLLCAVLAVLPAVSGGASYDLHENCFLLPLVLWLFYAIDRKSTAMTAVFAVLVLFVKEDAAMYVAIIGLWLVVKTLLRFDKSKTKELLTGVGMLGVSLLWFFLVTAYLARHGDGVMTYRYDNFMYDGSSSLMTVVKSVLLNPMKALFECADTEKVEYVFLTMLPLAGLPLLTRRYERLLLLVPYLLVNLMSDYQYQHDVMFQYNFGTTAFLLYLVAVNLSDLKLQRYRVLPMVLALFIGVQCFAVTVFPTAAGYSDRVEEKEDYYDSIRAALDLIPEGVPAAATNAYTAYLSERAVLYDVKRCTFEQILETEYVALGRGSTSSFKNYASDGQSDGFANLVQRLEENGYTLYEEVPGVLVIYKKN